MGESTAGILPVHIFGYPADLPALGGSPSRSRDRPCSRTPARRSAPSTAGHERSARTGNVATFAFYANKQMTTGEGGSAGHARTSEVAERLRSERNQGRAPDMGQVDHDRARLQLPAHRPAGGDRHRASSSGSTRCSNARDNVAAALPRAAHPARRRARRRATTTTTGLVLPCENRGDERRSWFVFAVQLPAGIDRDAVIASLAEDGHRLQGVPALHPPAAALSRALRLQGRRVPGRGARRGALARAARSSPR